MFSFFSFYFLAGRNTGGDFFIGDTIVKKDSSKIKTKNYWSTAKKATIMSTCLPGLGQVYNKKYWKTPVIYAALGGLGYSIYSNHTNYAKWQEALVLRGDTNPNNNTYLQYSNDNLVTLKRYYRKFRDLSIMGAALVYVIQIIDANVDGHLQNFDVDDISFNISPYNSCGKDFTNRNYTGLSLALNF